MTPRPATYKFTRAELEAVIKETRGNLSAAARKLACSRRTLSDLLAKHSLARWARRLRWEAEGEQLKEGGE